MDIVHIHGGAGGVFFLRKLNKKVIITAHTNNYLFQYRHLHKISKKFLSYPERYSYNIADVIIAVSSYIKNNLVKDYCINSEKIHIIPNGVNTSEFYTIPTEKSGPKIVLYVGRIDKRKGLEFLIEALEIVLKYDHNVHLLVAGEGNYITVITDFLKGKRVKEKNSISRFFEQ